MPFSKSNAIFYNQFHSGVSIQKKIVERSSFTYRNVLNAIRKSIHLKMSSVLDYGCGVGTIDYYLASKGHKVLGVDISPKAIKSATESSKAIGVSENATFGLVGKEKGKKFDVVVCFEVIEHVSHDEGLLVYLYKCLNKGGTLILSTPSINAPLYKLGLAEGFDDCVGHLRRYDPKELTKMVQKAGFEVKEVIKTEGFVRNSLFVIKSLGFLVRFIKGPISDLVTFVDDLTVKLFGESDIFVVAKKK